MEPYTLRTQLRNGVIETFYAGPHGMDLAQLEFVEEEKQADFPDLLIPTPATLPPARIHSIAK